MNPGSLAVAAGAALVAGAVNAAAGGGSFISFPTLVFLGVPPINATATNASAMWIGASGTITGFREDLAQRSPRFWAAVATAFLGGTTGALLLLHTPPKTFSAIVPWLLLLSTALFAASPWINKFKRSGGTEVREVPFVLLPALFCVSCYGGFFSGGQGLLILAFLALIGMTDLRRMNGLKAIFQFVNNGAPVIPFILARALVWDVAIAAAAGAVLGGYYGARLTRRIPPLILRILIIGVGVTMSLIFFFRGV